MNKQQIRQYIRHYGQSITEIERREAAKKILASIEMTEQFTDAQSIALYVNLPDEVATRDWIERWLKMGRRVLLPRISGDDIAFYDFNSDGLQIGSFGILEPIGVTPAEPSEIDLMILPGVAFCRDGRRLGRGKGFYDRYLAHDSFRAFTIGVGFAHQLTYDIPCEPHDRVLDMIITPYEESPITNLISRIIDSAWSDASRIGCDVDRLISMGLSWVLLRYKMELTRTPETNEAISIETWINSCSRVVTSRNFIIRDASGEVIGEATSQWCIIDLDSRRPMDLTHSRINYSQFMTPRKDVITITGKLQSINPATPHIERYCYQTTKTDIDFNRHVNTFKYIEMMLHMLPHTICSHRGESHIDIQFIHESYLGEELTILHKRESEADNTISSTRDSTFEIVRPDGTSAVRARLTL